MPWWNIQYSIYFFLFHLVIVFHSPSLYILHSLPIFHTIYSLSLSLSLTLSLFLSLSLSLSISLSLSLSLYFSFSFSLSLSLSLTLSLSLSLSLSLTLLSYASPLLSSHINVILTVTLLGTSVYKRRYTYLCLCSASCHN